MCILRCERVTVPVQQLYYCLCCYDWPNLSTICSKVTQNIWTMHWQILIYLFAFLVCSTFVLKRWWPNSQCALLLAKWNGWVTLPTYIIRQMLSYRRLELCQSLAGVLCFKGMFFMIVSFWIRDKSMIGLYYRRFFSREIQSAE